jgi:hypothetical protein
MQMISKIFPGPELEIPELDYDKNGKQIMYRCMILMWASLLQQENNPAATGNVNYCVDYNQWTFM